MMAQEALREDVAQEREAFRAWMEAVDPARLVVVDESGICTGMRLSYGYAPRGRRALDRAPARHGRRLSLIGWMDLFGSGVVTRKWGTVKREHFCRFAEEDLIPALCEGDIVVWDNAKIHDDEHLVQKIEAKGAELKRLPRYSPDFNPIEMLWSKLKHFVKKARADTNEALVAALEQAGSHVRASDMLGWFEHCGYHPQSI